MSLPALVETAGWVVYFDDELRVWINHPAEGSTLQLRVSASHEIHELSPLPIVTAGAVRCGQEFVVTGADSNGRPVVVGSAVDGSLLGSTHWMLANSRDGLSWLCTATGNHLANR